MVGCGKSIEPGELQAAAGRRERLPNAAVQTGTARAISCAVDRLIPRPVTATPSLFDTDLLFSHAVLVGL